jgi:hypothetical protein
MSSGGYRPAAGRPLKSTKVGISRALKNGLSPLEYMLHVMNDPEVDSSRRDRMAIAAAPYVHGRAAEEKPGKKEIATQEAFEAGDGTDWGDDLAPATRLN